MTVIGIDGLPPLNQATNVVVPSITMRLLFKLHPTLNPKLFSVAIKHELMNDVPYSCNVDVSNLIEDPGWDMKPLPFWLAKAVDDASLASFG